MPIFLYLAAAALSLWATGCSKDEKSTQVRYSKDALVQGEPEPLCPGDGYENILDHLGWFLAKGQGESIPLDVYFKEIKNHPCIEEILKNPKRAEIVEHLLKDIAGKDGQKDSLSAYDFLVGGYHLYDEKLQENGTEWFFKKRENFSLNDQIRILGSKLSDAKAPAKVVQQTRDLLRSFLIYLNQQPILDPNAAAIPLLEYFLFKKEPKIFSKKIGVKFDDFIRLAKPDKSRLFAKTIDGEFPNDEVVFEMASLLSSSEMTLLTRECFKNNLTASLNLFEDLYRLGAPLPAVTIEHKTDESEFFPNLPQNTPYLERQQAIDALLGTPALEIKKEHPVGEGRVIRTVLKKYYWVGDTEIFSIESENPGPTTLVFAPHFHEDNPRKMFHWIKDIPLETGRILLMPEANRYLGTTGGDTRPMNDIFNESLSNDRIDFLIVRRTEYLMGLVDGMIGLHDWRKLGPFFISDVVKSEEGEVDPNRNPAFSPWVPEEVKKIQTIDHPIVPEGKWFGVADDQETQGVGKNTQAPWRIAEYAARELDRLTGIRFPFVVSTLSNENAVRADNATAYMNYFLKKPAMTFEGLKGAEQGQLLAMATYGLLLAYGHKVPEIFEQQLKNPYPPMEPDLYVGLPIETPFETEEAFPRLPILRNRDFTTQ